MSRRRIRSGLRPDFAPALLSLALVSGCLAPVDNQSPDGATPRADLGASSDLASVDAAPVFEPSPPSVYVVKVKQILTGQPATDDEVASVVKDPTTMGALVDKWAAQPEFQGRMLDFFRNAFQQNNVVLGTMAANQGMPSEFRINPAYSARLARSIMDSFGNTAWSYVDSGKPFNGTLTTDTYMVTTAQLVLLSYYDDLQTADDGSRSNRLASSNVITAPLVFDPASTNTVTQSLDATNPATYMVWPDPYPKSTCGTPAKNTYSTAAKYEVLFESLFGFGECPNPNPNGVAATVTALFTPVLTDADFADWHPVQIVAATGPSASPSYYDLPALRTATQLALHTTRIGFAGTLAFQANWATNASNEARVTANQSLIVGIGQSIDGENVTSTFPVDSTDLDHATAPACQGCHSQLDPFKQYFRQSWTLTYHDQEDSTVISLAAGFDIDGVDISGGVGVPSIMQTLATHPRYPLAWTQKLYFWATSRAADETDPELLRIANVFATSGYNFKSLVHELFSSPLTTYASATKTTSATGGLISIARRDQLCTAVSNRLGISDACGAETATPTAIQTTIATDSALVATDSYFRAYALPSLPTQPDLFFRASTETVCEQVATEVVTDDGVSGLYKTSDPTSAITDMVSNVMGLPPSDARTAAVTQVLQQHFTAAQAVPGGTLVQALRSTFTLACESPSSVIVGL